MSIHPIERFFHRPSRRFTQAASEAHEAACVILTRYATGAFTVQAKKAAFRQPFHIYRIQKRGQSRRPI